MGQYKLVAVRVQGGMVTYRSTESGKTGHTSLADFCRLMAEGIATLNNVRPS